MPQNYSVKNLVISGAAGGAIRKYRFVKVSAANTFSECDAEEVSIGASKNAVTTAGEITEIVKSGIAILQAGGTITAGAFVNSDADGKAVAEASTNKWASGIALQAAVDGDYISVDLDGAGYISSS
jgi:hypothetical protein